MDSGSKHPDWESILAHAEGTKPDAAIEAHLQSCRPCASIAEAIRELLDSMESSRLDQVPSSLIEKTIAMLREEFASGTARNPVNGPGAAIAEWIRRLGRPIRELAASLVTDSLDPSAALRQGGEAKVPSRTLLFEADELQVLIGLSPRPDAGRDLHGQIMPPGGADLPERASVLLERESDIEECPVGDSGEFEFRPLPGDTTALAILVDDRLVQLRLPR